MNDAEKSGPTSQSDKGLLKATVPGGKKLEVTMATSAQKASDVSSDQ